MSCECKCPCFTKWGPIKELCALSNYVQMPALRSSVWDVSQQWGVLCLPLNVRSDTKKRQLFYRVDHKLFNGWSPSYPWFPTGSSPPHSGLFHRENSLSGNAKFNLSAQFPQIWTALKTETIYCFSITQWWWEIVFKTGKLWHHQSQQLQTSHSTASDPPLESPLLNCR